MGEGGRVIRQLDCEEQRIEDLYLDAIRTGVAERDAARARVRELEAREAALVAALRELRRPIICSIFGVPEEEVKRLVGIIDAALVAAPATAGGEAEG